MRERKLTTKSETCFKPRARKVDTRYMSASHRHAPGQEKALAGRLLARQVKGSGCGYEVGDVRIEGIARIDCKSTIHSSYSIGTKVVEKLQLAAMQTGEVPIFQIDFLDAGGDPLHQLAVMPLWALEQLIAGQAP